MIANFIIFFFLYIYCVVRIKRKMMNLEIFFLLYYLDDIRLLIVINYALSTLRNEKKSK